MCIAKDGGEKLTRRGIDGCEKKNTMSEGSPPSSIFDPRMCNLHRGILGWGTQKKICPHGSVLRCQYPMDFQGKRANLAKWIAV